MARLKPDTRAQIHADFAQCAHLKRVSSAQTVSCALTTLYAHALDIHSFRTFLFLTFSVHIFYRVQCERSDPLTWARKKIRIIDRVCELGVRHMPSLFCSRAPFRRASF